MTGTILVLDESEAVRTKLSEALESAGYATVRCATGAQARAVLAARPFDVVILDAVLPDESGVELIREIRAGRLDTDAASPTTRDILLIVLSSVGDRDLILDAFRAGADDYIAKSSDLEVLTARIHAQLRREHFEDGSRRAREQLLRTELEETAHAARELAESEAHAQSELLASQAFLESVVRNIPDMIVVKDAVTLRFEAINPAGVELLGYPEHEVVGKLAEDVYPPELANSFTSSDHALLAHGGMLDVPAVVVQTRYHGTKVLHSKKIVINGPDGNPRYILGISEDITERQRAEEELRQAKEEAERANHAKSEFLSRMSHELRTPLNAVLGYGQLLELDGLEAHHQESVTQIIRGGTHLLKLIDEVLDVSRIEAGEMSLSLEPVALHDAVTEALDLVRPMADNRRIGLVSQSVALDTVKRWHVHADRQRLKQVLLNLLSNAIKYNYDGGAVTVTCQQIVEDRLRISVSDSGQGIPEDKLDRLFSPFERLGAEHTSVQGTGLGLALTRRLVEAMNGTIGVQSALGSGTTFSVELESTASPDDTSSVGAGSDTDASDMDTAPQITVLFVEDNLANVRLVERIVERRPNVNLLVAMQGRLGIELATLHQPDLVLLDLNLPDLDGEVVLQRLRADRRTRDTQIVIVSADATPGQAARLIDSGADGYVTKPFPILGLLALLDEAAEARAKSLDAAITQV